MQRGYCNHKDKNCRIVTEWKCVDIRFPDIITAEDKALREKTCRAKDYYGVCELCKHFKPDEPSVAPAVEPAKPNVTPAYTAGKTEKSSTAQGTEYEDPAWDSMMDEII